MIGQKIDKYHIREEIGHGGMAVVYRAEDEVLHREVAIKVMHPHLAKEAEAVLRFRREATTVAKLRHTNIIEIFDYSGDDSAFPYIVTELIEAGTLADLFFEGRKIPEEIAAYIGLFVARALEHAHKQGIVHRDLKPENVMFHIDGTLKLMDFGIARALEEVSMTMTGTLVGSPAYMSPEQASGAKIDPRSDLFSLGTIIYQAVCGHLPFDGESPPVILRKIFEGDYMDPQQCSPGISNSFALLLRKLLQTDLTLRYQSASEVVRELEKYLEASLVDDPEEELKHLLTAPELYLEEFEKREVKWLEERAVALRRRRPVEAMQLYSRLLAIDPEHAEANRHLQAIINRRIWKRRITLSASLLVILIIFSSLTLQAYNHWDEILDSFGLLTAPEQEGPLYSMPEEEYPSEDVQKQEAAKDKKAQEKKIVNEKMIKKQPAAKLVKIKNGIKLDKEKKNDKKVAAADFTGNLRVFTVPWSDVYIDGKKIGQYPLDANTVFPLQLKAGKHKVRFVNPSCLPLEEIIEIKNPGQEVELRRRLNLRPATLSVVNSQKAMLFVDGKFKGYTPMAKPVEVSWSERVSEKTVEIILRKEGFLSVSRKLKLSAGKNTDLNIELVKK